MRRGASRSLSTIQTVRIPGYLAGAPMIPQCPRECHPATHIVVVDLGVEEEVAVGGHVGPVASARLDSLGYRDPLAVRGRVAAVLHPVVAGIVRGLESGDERFEI